MQTKSPRDLKTRSAKFSLNVIKFSSGFPYSRELEIILKQLIRAGTSIAANIVEGQGAASKKDFTNYLQIAFKSAKETKYWLWLLKESNLTNRIEQISELENELVEMIKMLTAALLTIKSTAKTQNHVKY